MVSKWVKNAVIYQINTSSFYDGNNDGIGDFKGIVDKLSYISNLGVNTILLTNVLKSDDNGFVKDHYNVNSDNGNLDDFKNLIEETHKMNMKIFIAFSINNVSKEHPIFKENISDSNTLFLIEKNINNSLPNNFTRHDNTSVWEVDDKNKFYYYSTIPGSVDFNWQDERIKKYIVNTITHYLKMGIDGIRLDDINCIGKADFKSKKQLRLAKNKFHTLNAVSEAYLNSMKLHITLSFPEAVIILNNYNPHHSSPVLTFSKASLPIIQQNNSHLLIDEDYSLSSKDVLRHLHNYITSDHFKYSKLINVLSIESDGSSRALLKFNTDDHIYREKSAKMLATFFYLYKCIPLIYQGQEIGMTNYSEKTLESLSISELTSKLNSLKNKNLSNKKLIQKLRQGHPHNPVFSYQWDEALNGGFTNAESKIPLNKNYLSVNARGALEDKDSIYHYYREILKIKDSDEYDIFDSEIRSIITGNEYILAYEHRFKDFSIEVFCNFSPKVQGHFINRAFNTGELILNNYSSYNPKELEPYQALAFKIRHK